MNKKMEELEAREKAFNAQVAEQKKQFEEERRKIREEERERQHREREQFKANLAQEIMNEYSFNKAVAEKIVAKGWEDGHSYGYSEVRTQAHIAAEFAQEVIKAAQC